MVQQIIEEVEVVANLSHRRSNLASTMREAVLMLVDIEEEENSGAKEATWVSNDRTWLRRSGILDDLSREVLTDDVLFC